MPIRICAYATPGPYQSELAAMLTSVEETFKPGWMRTVTEIAVPPPCADAGPARWLWATAHKPTFLLRLLRDPEIQADWLLYVDADARFCGPAAREKWWQPVIDCLGDNVMAGHIFCHPRKGLELLSGTLLLRRCEETIALVEKWEHACQNQPATWDQKHLENVIQNAGPVKFCNLPPEWCWIDGGRTPIDYSEEAYGKRDPFILHTQASRRLKR